MAGSNKSEIRKEQILKAAERVFAQKGFHDATISDVSREARVSDATIYEYFSSKEELLFSIPGETSRRHRLETEAILNFIPRASDKIRCIIKRYFWFYDTHPDHAAVSMLILKHNRKFIEVPAYQEVKNMSRLILKVIEDGMSQGEFRKNLDPYLVRAAVLGTIEHLVIRKILLGKPDRLEPLAEPLAELILQGISAPKGDGPLSLRLVWDPGLEQTHEKTTPSFQPPKGKD